jgi:membrane-bound metal-dependent hydrolase YbcI (DUF457 family)
MAKHRRLIVTAVVLAVAALVPTSALASVGGTDRPLRGTELGTTTLNLATGAATAEFTGEVSHLGRFNGHSSVTVTFTGPSSFAAAGTGTLIAADGDELFFDVTWMGTFTATTIHTTVDRTIIGGTGRFAGASGTMTAQLSSVYSLTTLLSFDTGTTEGVITY